MKKIFCKKFSLIIGAIAGVSALTPFLTFFSCKNDNTNYFIVENNQIVGLNKSGYQQSHLVIPDGITAIGDNAFANATKLTAIIIPSSVVSIGKGAFNGCFSLMDITIPNSVKSIGDGVFKGCPNKAIYHITSDVIQNFLLNSHSNITDNQLRNPYLLTSPDGGTIGGVYETGWKLASLFIPNSVTAIKDDAFKSCSALTTITIPSSVKNIGSNILTGCKNLSSVTNNSTVLFDWWVQNHEYNGQTLSQMHEVDLSQFTNSANKPFTIIGDSAFQNAEMLQSITIPENIISIGLNAFSGCSQKLIYNVFNSEVKDNLANSQSGINLNQLRNPYLITSLDETTITSVNSNGQAQSNIFIPSIVTTIGENAFNNCSLLTNITIPDSVITIEAGAFKGCSKQVIYNIFSENVQNELLNSQSAIENNQLRNPYLITSADGTSVSDVSKEGKQQKELFIPNSVTTIQQSAFNECPLLTTITIPNTVTHIDTNTFANFNASTNIINRSTVLFDWWVQNHEYNGQTLSQMSNIDLTNFTNSDGKAFTIIENGAFINASLREITIPNTVKNIGANVFKGCGLLTKVTNNSTVLFDWWVKNHLYHVNNGLFALDITLDKMNTVNLNRYTNSNNEKFTVISDNAFHDCVALKTLIISDVVTIIGKGAFWGCTQLGTIIFGSAIQIIDDFAFYNCDNLFAFTIPSAVKKIGQQAFVICSYTGFHLETYIIEILSLNTDIGAYAFYGHDLSLDTRYLAHSEQVKQNLINSKSAINPNSISVITNH